MRSIVAIVTALFFTASLQISAPQQAPPPTIEGVVLRGDTSTPLAGATVTLELVDTGVSGVLGAPSRPLPGVQPATTDLDGRFAFSNLTSGMYRIYATATGYVVRAYGQDSAGSLAAPVPVGSERPVRDATIRLMPVGTISGRVLDENGKPAVGAPVQVYRASPNAPSQFLPSGRGIVNGRGDYQVFSVEPGRYFVSVGSEERPSGPAQVTGPIYAFRFFPGVASIDQALPVDLQPGSELTVDLITDQQKTYRVRGTVIDGATGRPASGWTMQLATRSLAGGTSTLPVAHSSGPGGTFEVQVPSGSFVLQAQLRVLDEAARAAGEAAWSMFPTARVPIQVKDADVEGIVMVITRPAAIPGQVRFEGNTRLPLSSTTFRLRPLGSEWLPPTAFVSSDGAFRVDGVLEGRYSVSFGGAPQGFQIKSIEYAGTDILTKPWEFSGSAAGRIEVVLSSGVAQLSGLVRDAKSQTVSGGSVTLIPDQRSRTDLYRLAVTDQNGRYIFAGVAPGSYKVFSWQSMEFGAYLNPNFIQPFEQEGRAIRLAEGSSENADLRLIVPR